MLFRSHTSICRLGPSGVTRVSLWQGQTALVTLNVGRGGIELLPRKVAEYLLDLFPKLREIEAYLPDDPDELIDIDYTDEGMIWGRVGKILQGEPTYFTEDEDPNASHSDEDDDSPTEAHSDD